MPSLTGQRMQRQRQRLLCAPRVRARCCQGHKKDTRNLHRAGALCRVAPAPPGTRCIGVRDVRGTSGELQLAPRRMSRDTVVSCGHGKYVCVYRTVCVCWQALFLPCFFVRTGPLGCAGRDLLLMRFEAWLGWEAGRVQRGWLRVWLAGRTCVPSKACWHARPRCTALPTGPQRHRNPVHKSGFGRGWLRLCDSLCVTVCLCTVCVGCTTEVARQRCVPRAPLVRCE